MSLSHRIVTPGSDTLLGAGIRIAHMALKRIDRLNLRHPVARDCGLRVPTRGGLLRGPIDLHHPYYSLKVAPRG